MLKYINIIAYTDIEIDFTDALSHFEALDETGIIDGIISCIPEREYASFKNIMDMVINDIWDMENCLTAYLDRKIKSFNDALAVVKQTLPKNEANDILDDGVKQDSEKK